MNVPITEEVRFAAWTTQTTTATTTATTITTTQTQTTSVTSTFLTSTTSTLVAPGGEYQYQGYQIVAAPFEKTLHQNESIVYDLGFDYTSSLTEFTVQSILFNARWVTLEDELPKNFELTLLIGPPTVKIRISPAGVTPAQYLVRCDVTSSVGGGTLIGSSYLKVIVLPVAVAATTELAPAAQLPITSTQAEIIVGSVSAASLALGLIRRRRESG
jgi:hypothetical protein